MNIHDITKQIRAFADQLEEQNKPDPYAELKAAHAAGKVIQGLIGGHWIDSPHPTWKYPVETYRTRPEEQRKQDYEQYGFGTAITIAEPPFQLPPPPPGMQWHRKDGWKAEDLPPGMRPLVVDEEEQFGDEYWSESGECWRLTPDVGRVVSGSFRLRSTRPLVFTHNDKQWTYHRPGDPMPCEDRRIYILCKDGIDRENHVSPDDCRWSEENTADILGWRYAEPLTREVELGPEDVPPGSVLRLDKWDHAYTSGAVFLNGVHLLWPISRAVKFLRWSELQKEWLINRPRHRDENGNPTKWEKCSKEVPA